MADFYNGLDFILETAVKSYGDASKEKAYHCDPSNDKHYADGLLMGSKWGITAADYSHVNPNIRRNDVRELSLEEASNIHKDMFWDVIEGDLIESQQIANSILDAYYNMGDIGINIMQCVCNMYGHRLKIDGNIGPKTISALNKTIEEFEPAFYNMLNSAYRQFYLYLFRRDDVDMEWKMFFSIMEVKPFLKTQMVDGVLDNQLSRICRAGGMSMAGHKDKIHIISPTKAMVRSSRPAFLKLKNMVQMVFFLILAIILMAMSIRV